MGYQNSSVQAYRQTRVKTASPGKLIVMLYDEALRQLDMAIGLLEEDTKQLDRVNNAVVRAQDVVTELIASLDLEQGGEIARNLFRLYLYFNTRLMDGNVRKEVAPLREVRRLMHNLREAWKQIEATPVGGERPASGGGLNIAG